MYVHSMHSKVMDLKTFMESAGMKSSDLAKAIGRDPSIVAKYRMRQIMPPLDVANAIVKLSGGLVTHEDLMPLPSAAERVA
jgi:ribosome-binding protein aMBF1 (putative translation factor)